MNEYIILIRIDPSLLTRLVLEELKIKWGVVIQKWIKQQRLIESKIFRQKGFIISGHPDKKIIHDYFLEKGMAVTGYMILLAHNIEEAIELSGECPTINYGGNIEVRELQNPLK